MWLTLCKHYFGFSCAFYKDDGILRQQIADAIDIKQYEKTVTLKHTTSSAPALIGRQGMDSQFRKI